MSMGKRVGDHQAGLWLPTTDLARSPGHPFYEKLNVLLAEVGFDTFVEGLCRPFYADGGRRGIEPEVYFRMLLIGYFEGIEPERGIAWRCADSLALRSFLGFSLAVDMDSGAVVAVTLHGGVAADTHTIYETMQAACKKSVMLGRERVPEWVADKGYHTSIPNRGSRMSLESDLEYT
jgi:transposase